MTHDQLAIQTLEAVESLLNHIKEDPKGHGGVSASSAAKAVRDLLETPLLAESVRLHFITQRTKSPDRGLT